MIAIHDVIGRRLGFWSPPFLYVIGNVCAKFSTIIVLPF